MAAAMRALLQSFTDGAWRDLDTVPLVARDESHRFSSGKVGYNGNDKLMLPSLKAENNGEMRQHQATFNIVEIEPKSGADPDLKPGDGRSTEKPIAGAAPKK